MMKAQGKHMAENYFDKKWSLKLSSRKSSIMPNKRCNALKYFFLDDADNDSDYFMRE